MTSLIGTLTFERMHVLCRILVSSTRKPISYINLAKRFLQEHGEVQLSALGIAVAPMVTVAEILKNRRLAVERKITTSLEVLSDDYRWAVCDACLFSDLMHLSFMPDHPTGTSVRREAAFLATRWKHAAEPCSGVCG